MSTPVSSARSVAHANIALIKYWGKLERPGNFPAVPSLSLTLDGLRTVTRIELAPELAADVAELDGEAVSGRPAERITQLLSRVRARAAEQAGSRELARLHARVSSRNHFPTAAGLASSASGFAALAHAANVAYRAGLTTAELSAQARESSASAARSLYPGWVGLEAGAESAQPLAPAEHWQVGLLVAVTALGKKAVGSTEAMNLTRATSPYYPAWVQQAPQLYAEAVSALAARDLRRLGQAMEQSTWMMHASMFASAPAIVYFAPTTLAVLARLRELRAEGLLAYATMDAGPHVKILAERASIPDLEQALRAVPGVLDLLSCVPGAGAHSEDPSSGLANDATERREEALK